MKGKSPHAGTTNPPVMAASAQPKKSQPPQSIMGFAYQQIFGPDSQTRYMDGLKEMQEQAVQGMQADRNKRSEYTNPMLAPMFPGFVPTEQPMKRASPVQGLMD